MKYSHKPRPPHAARILATGFGPFPGVPFNASATLVEHMAAHSDVLPPGVTLHIASLPTEWRRAAAIVRQLAAELHPHIILHFGVSGRARGFVLETRAVNITDGSEDCTGCLPPGRCVSTGGRAVMESTLPMGRLLQQLRMSGLPAGLSRDAGRYLCNALLYETLTYCKPLSPAPLAGFIHIPSLTEAEFYGLRRRRCGWEELKKGAAVILRTAGRLAIEQRQRALCSRPILR